MTRRRTDRRDAFTLLELMIVVALISIILAVAIPSLQGASKSAKEARAIGHLRMAVTVNEQYHLRFGSYAPTVQELVDSGVLLHSRPAGASGPDGYGYTYVATADTFAIQAFPDTPGVTGDRYFYVDQNGMIRESSTGPATALSAALD